MATIRVIDEAEATGRLEEAYADVRRRRGSVADIMKVQSLLPDTIAAHLDFYVAVQFGKGSKEGLGRAEREMLAVVVSAANRCDYCVAHHGDALDRYWKDPARVDRLARDWRHAGLSEAEAALCAFAENLTRAPGDVRDVDVEALRNNGFADEAILQAILTTAYFNFVNRVALATGIDPSGDVAKEYAY